MYTYMHACIHASIHTYIHVESLPLHVNPNHMPFVFHICIYIYICISIVLEALLCYIYIHYRNIHILYIRILHQYIHLHTHIGWYKYYDIHIFIIYYILYIPIVLYVFMFKLHKICNIRVYMYIHIPIFVGKPCSHFCLPSRLREEQRTAPCWHSVRGTRRRDRYGVLKKCF